MIDSLHHLEKITKELPSLDYVLSTNLSVVEYPAIKGTCYGFPLYRNKDVSIIRVFMSKGSIFPEHLHPESVEYYIVYRGSLEYTNYSTNHTRIINVGESAASCPKQSHNITALEDCEFVVIKIPPDSKEIDI